MRGIEKALRHEFGEDIVVIPTNAYQPPSGGVHPFGGMTYEEQVEDKKQTL